MAERCPVTACNYRRLFLDSEILRCFCVYLYFPSKKDEKQNLQFCYLMSDHLKAMPLFVI